MKKATQLAALGVLSLALTNCSYHVMGKSKEQVAQHNHVKTAKVCGFAPLWLAPFNKDFANVDMIAANNNFKEVVSVEQKIYPYVLFTVSCTVVHGK